MRFISNESSGKQGYEMALALAKLGIKTTLIAGPSKIKYSKDLKIENITTALEMLNSVKKKLPVDIIICAAAVSDFKPKKFSNTKLKKSKIFDTIELEKNPDILEYVGKTNKSRPKLVIGFSAETENIIKNSFDKLKNKHCDLIIANDVSKKDIGFNADYNQVSLINKKGEIEVISKRKKSAIATIIAKKILDKFLINDKNIN